MELEPEFTFVSLQGKNYFGLNDKTTQQYLEKWGIRTNLIIQNFSFNEPFQMYHKHQIANAFFQDKNVSKSLLTRDGKSWKKQELVASSVEVKQVPCTILNMSFFNKLKNVDNRIINKSGTICKRYDIDIDGFLVTDNLQGMLLDEECDEYKLYSEKERKEFIFRIFQLLVLGGELCQYEDVLEPYLDITKKLYKDLTRVEKHENLDNMSVATVIMEVIAKDYLNKAYFPYNYSHRQNIGFLLIDPHNHEITSILHQFGENPQEGKVNDLKLQNCMLKVNHKIY